MSLDTIIELSNANIKQSEKTVLQNVNLKLIKGEFAYLIGKTASGKSSLIKTLYGELPFEGDYGYVAGFDLSFVLKATGWKNKKEIDERIHDVLEKVDLLDKLHKLPFQLSGGEQQRVVIARALLNDPELIVADEPTGNLDPETSDEIMKLLVKISKTGRSVLMATHNYSLLKKFPARTLRCENGMLTEMIESEEIIDFEQLMIDDTLNKEDEPLVLF